VRYTAQLWDLRSSSTETMVRHRCQKVCHCKGVEHGKFDYCQPPGLRIDKTESNRARAGDAKKRCGCRTDFLGRFVDPEGEGRTGCASDLGTYCMADNDHGLYHCQISRSDESGRGRVDWRALRYDRASRSSRMLFVGVSTSATA
jgi:hypothetical protein